MDLLQLLIKLNILVLFNYRLLDKICYKIKDLISKNSGITNSINNNFEKIKIDSYNSFTRSKNIDFS